ncbi:hypothetical protein OGAPHI_007117 [Ogataea philodendri]|uniref:Uncharacterized protein n=1 Tax=Ogataea philodendri TaxID=1378263 RepID=A0A9P8T0F0_9ASCO|nr:uncharacterized protein OGAPHI_007117 [Ogataea philodendri]KAH3660531.1 hypothetical protein OGAPHI_007117 [Ogataea philodendri]
MSVLDVYGLVMLGNLSSGGFELMIVAEAPVSLRFSFKKLLEKFCESIWYVVTMSRIFFGSKSNDERSDWPDWFTNPPDGVVLVVSVALRSEFDGNGDEDQGEQVECCCWDQQPACPGEIGEKKQHNGDTNQGGRNKGQTR